MDYSFIKYLNDGSTAIIILNRPDTLNSFNRAMGLELRVALETAESDTSIRAILITGEGKAFCAGQDLKEITEDGSIKNPFQIVEEIYNPIIRHIRNINKPIVCAVNGTAAGAGANIALCCDIVTAANNASFIQAFSKIGLIPDSGGTFFLPRLVGLQRASSMMMLNEKISSEEAYVLGMIYKVFEAEDLYRESLVIANQLSKMPTQSIGYIKQALNKSFNNDLESQLELEALLQQKAGETDDYKEGIKAFLEKRQPSFKGK